MLPLCENHNLVPLKLTRTAAFPKCGEEQSREWLIVLRADREGAASPPPAQAAHPPYVGV